MSAYPDTRCANANWRIAPEPGRAHVSCEQARLAVLMDIRDELQELRQQQRWQMDALNRHLARHLRAAQRERPSGNVFARQFPGYIRAARQIGVTPARLRAVLAGKEEDAGITAALQTLRHPLAAVAEAAQARLSRALQPAPPAASPSTPQP